MTTKYYLKHNIQIKKKKTLSACVHNKRGEGMNISNSLLNGKQSSIGGKGGGAKAAERHHYTPALLFIILNHP